LTVKLFKGSKNWSKKLQNSGFTAFSAGDTVMGVYLVFLNTFKLSNNLMGPKTGATA
jgi:hypothetical protein